MTQGTYQSPAWVRDMFGRITPSYDLLNHLLSFNIDRFWRAHTVRRVESILKRPDARVLDLCCGTGDLMLALEARRGSAVMGGDFCHPMLVEAARKGRERRMSPSLFEGDALQMPFADDSLDLITVAFGFRNFANYRQGLAELLRVLRPGGCLAILECSRPKNPILAAGYNLYSTVILPTLGGLVSGARDAYAYLPESVRKFPGAEELANAMREVGFRDVEFDRLTGGIVALHLGKR